jgi:hypothetical protein
MRNWDCSAIRRSRSNFASDCTPSLSRVGMICHTRRAIYAMEALLKEMEERFGQLIALIWIFLHKLLPFNLTVVQVQELIKNKNHPFWAAFDQATKLLTPQPIVSDTDSTVDTQKQIDFWISFYKKHFKIDLDPSEIKIAERRSGFNWLVIVAKGVSLNQVWEVCQKHFKCWKYGNSDLESLIQESERGPAKATNAFWFRDRVEADEETKNLSANQQTEAGITLIARCLLELKYFSEMGKHLDLKNVTLCSGSRFADGGVPYAYWRGGEFDVSWHYVDYRHPGLRSRVAVG